MGATPFTGDVGFGVTAGTNKWIVWEAVRDWPDRFSTNVFFRIMASDVPPGMVLIPAGPFTMGDSLDGDVNALPLHTNQISAFYMDQYEVTKAEWEKAARGGASGKRFPWSGTNNITHSLANYYCLSSVAYDTSPTRGYHPSFQAGGYPYTSPVGYFASNGYGLYDMAGNVCERCWDWYGSYSAAPASDPRDPTSGSGQYPSRVVRGGSWDSVTAAGASVCRVAGRGWFFLDPPPPRFYGGGFRSVLPPGQP